MTILLFVDWLPTGQWFAKSPFSLNAGIYFILWTILYAETQVENVAGPISIILASVVIYALRIKVGEQGKGRIPGLVFYVYYSVHLLII